MSKYYERTERSPAYTASIVLNPSLKWGYFDEWPEEWFLSAKDATQKIWDEYYKSTTFTSSSITDEPTMEEGNEFMQWYKKRKGQSDLPMDEYERYCAQPTVPEVTDARLWWMQSQQRKSFLALSLMAIDLLSIPAMSAEPERLFFSAKLSLNVLRNRLKKSSVNAAKCLKSWYRMEDSEDPEDD